MYIYGCMFEKFCIYIEKWQLWIRLVNNMKMQTTEFCSCFENDRLTAICLTKVNLNAVNKRWLRFIYLLSFLREKYPATSCSSFVVRRFVFATTCPPSSSISPTVCIPNLSWLHFDIKKNPKNMTSTAAAMNLFTKRQCKPAIMFEYSREHGSGKNPSRSSALAFSLQSSLYALFDEDKRGIKHNCRHVLVVLGLECG